MKYLAEKRFNLSMAPFVLFDHMNILDQYHQPIGVFRPHYSSFGRRDRQASLGELGDEDVWRSSTGAFDRQDAFNAGFLEGTLKHDWFAPTGSSVEEDVLAAGEPGCYAEHGEVLGDAGKHGKSVEGDGPTRIRHDRSLNGNAYKNEFKNTKTINEEINK